MSGWHRRLIRSLVARGLPKFRSYFLYMSSFKPTTPKLLLVVHLFLSTPSPLLIQCSEAYRSQMIRSSPTRKGYAIVIATMLILCVVMTFALVNDLLGYWPFGMSYCDTWIAFDVMCSTASIVNLCAISLDRYIHIKDPLRYGRWLTKRIVTTSIAVIWVLAALLSFLPISLGLHTNNNDSNKTQPTPDELLEELSLQPKHPVVTICMTLEAISCWAIQGLHDVLFMYEMASVMNSVRVFWRPIRQLTSSNEGRHTSSLFLAYATKTADNSHRRFRSSTEIEIVIIHFLALWTCRFTIKGALTWCTYPILAFFSYTSKNYNGSLLRILDHNGADQMTYTAGKRIFSDYLFLSYGGGIT
ncbi:unnamed protein product, partial [Meganyctiphanes norvegica]